MFGGEVLSTKTERRVNPPALPLTNKPNQSLATTQRSEIKWGACVPSSWHAGCQHRAGQ